MSTPVACPIDRTTNGSGGVSIARYIAPNGIEIPRRNFAGMPGGTTTEFVRGGATVDEQRYDPLALSRLAAAGLLTATSDAKCGVCGATSGAGGNAVLDYRVVNGFQGRTYWFQGSVTANRWFAAGSTIHVLEIEPTELATRLAGGDMVAL
jgi:hypothetical protein